MNKFFKFLRFNWLQFLIIGLGITIISVTVFFIASGIQNFASLESFSRKQLMAQNGLIMIVFFLHGILFAVFSAFIQYYIYMGGGMSKLLGGDSAEKVKPNVKWSEVVGMDDAKRDAWEIVEFLKDRKKLQAIGGTNIKGAMMIGPPGCGKTYLAKAIATEAGLPFLSAVGSEFAGMIVGLGAARMKSLFQRARKLAQMEGGCIIFIDEIDSFARPRASSQSFSGVASENATINQFLTEIDGLRQGKEQIFVLAATNVPEEDLDEAVMRSGRFDRKIYFQKPGAEEREKLLKFYLSKIKTDTTIDIPKIADQAKWFSPADINNMVREAAIIAQRDKRDTVTMEDLDKGLTRVISSLEKMGGDKILSSKVNVKWSEVIGMESAKREAQEVVNMLKDRQMLKAVGGRIVKGIMLMGPPGCGKTYLAKAMATEAGFPFISASGSQFIEMFVGVGPKRIRDLFKQARLLAKSEGGCLIFIDEIDAFARPRSNDQGFGGPSEYNATINQFLTELDGLRQDENNIVVLGATNVQENDLDSAIMRAGRFDRKIYIDLPNLAEREELFKYYLTKVKIDDSVKADIMARKCLWFSPASIQSMVREAGLFALREKRDTITYKDLSNAYDRVVYGDKSNINLSAEEKEWTAYHETGHAIIGYLLLASSDIIKATIIPHKGFLGQVRPVARREEFGHNREWYLTQIKMYLASYAAETIKFGSTSDGVGGSDNSDFHVATGMAHMMVWSWGMGKSGIIGDMVAQKGFLSYKIIEILNNDVQEILQSCLKESSDILNAHKDLFEYFAQELIKKGELEYDEIEAIFKKFNVKPKHRLPVNS